VGALERSGIRMAMSHALNAQLQSTLAGLAGFVLLVGGGIAIIDQAMSLGDLLTFYLAAGLLNGHAATISGAIPDVIAGGQSLGKLAALRGEAAEPPYRGRQAPVFRQALRLSDVRFGFGGDVLLEDVSLELAPGKVTVVFGANGAGKSTLVGLILGFHRPWSGQLSLDGLPYEAIDMAALRRQVGVVPQRPSFFPGSIADNIGYGRPDAGPAALDQAIDLAGARPFIDGLAGGLQAAMGEGGTLVSGGEAQKLAIARALVGHPGLLILDEPTNHLDAASITALMRKLAALPGGPAVLIISHNIQAAQFADRIFQLRDRRLHPVPDAAHLEAQDESIDA
jgi:ATP-binding cassette, subfamily B, bacterial